MREEMAGLRDTLHESEERFRATFDQAAVGIAHVCPEGRWLRVNQRLCDILGYPCKELITKTSQEITHPDDLDLDLALARRLFAGEIPSYQIEKRYIDKAGQVVWARLTGSVVKAADGTIRYAVAVVEDIARHKAEEAARQATEERFKALIETASDVITVMSPDGTIRYVSPSVERRRGIGPGRRRTRGWPRGGARHLRRMEPVQLRPRGRRRHRRRRPERRR